MSIPIQGKILLDTSISTVYANMSGGDLFVKKKGYFALLVFVITITIPLFTTFSRSPVIIIVDGYQVSFCDQEPGEWQETNPPPLDLSDYMPSL